MNAGEKEGTAGEIPVVTLTKTSTYMYRMQVAGPDSQDVKRDTTHHLEHTPNALGEMCRLLHKLGHDDILVRYR